MSEEDVIRYGQQAAAVLGNQAYQDAFRVVEEGLVNELAKSDNTPDRTMRLQTFLSLGRSYRKYLEKAMADGKFTAASLDEKRRWFNRAA
jgi:hypothetical protein